MIELATRGYLRRIETEIPPCGPGPNLIDVQSLSPEIGGVVDTSLLGPTISGQITSAPVITGGETDPIVSPADPPIISGGGPLVPGVNSEEDE